MMRLEQQTDAKLINRLVNHASVFPWVCGDKPFPLDMSGVVATAGNVVLCCDWGGVIFSKLGIGHYEAHTVTLPQGRGEGTMALGRAALEWMFCKTDAIEIMTRVAQGNIAAKAAMRAMSIRPWFVTGPIWKVDGRLVPMDVYKLHLLDWITSESGYLARAGQEFHRRLVQAGGAVDHGDDPTHDTHVGAAALMIEGGQPDKAVSAYNLWAAMAGYGMIGVASRNPLCIDIGTAFIEPASGRVRLKHQAA